jgi:hypothetical protein
VKLATGNVIGLEHDPLRAFADRVLQEDEQATDVDVLPDSAFDVIVRAPRPGCLALEVANYVHAPRTQVVLIGSWILTVACERGSDDLV